MSTEPRPKGFAWMKIHDPEKLRETARKGGKAAQEKGVAHQWTEDEARVAGEKGARTMWARKKKAEAEAGET